MQQTQYALDEHTRAFLTELLRELGETLRPGRAPGAEQFQRFLAAHLGVGHADQTIVAREYARPLSNQILIALEDLLSAAPFRTQRTVDYDDQEGERAPRYRSVPVSATDHRPVLEEGYYPTYFNDLPVVVGVVQNDKLEVWLHLRRSDFAIGDSIFKLIEDRPRLYRGQVIGLSNEGFPFFLSVPEAHFEDDVILEPEVQDEIGRHVLRFSEREATYREAGLPFRRGVILAGPPGVGKTQVFRALTHALMGRYTVLWVTPGTITWQCTMADVFAFARMLRPVLLLWEDLDLTVQDRKIGASGRELGELLTQLDGPAAADGIITCASTNDVAALDKALSARPSRFDRVLHVGPPGAAMRRRLLERFASGIDALEADLEEIAELTEGMSGADLRELVVSAFTCALDDTASEVTQVEPSAPVTTAHFRAALQRFDRRRDATDRWRTVWRAAAR